MSHPEKRLELVAPDLVQRLESISAEQLRRIAVDVCSLAVRRAGLEDRAVMQALNAMRDGAAGDSTTRQAVQSLTEQLDEVQWDIQDRGECGTATDAEHDDAFRKARAAAAVWFALAPDPLQAALECLYEASFAIENILDLRDTVDQAMG